MLMPSGLEYEQKAGYEKRDFYQPFVDTTRRGGILGDSDLTLQLILGNMEVASSPLDDSLEIHLKRLYELLEICEEPSNCGDRSYQLEAKLSVPEDISKALKRHQI